MSMLDNSQSSHILPKFFDADADTCADVETPSVDLKKQSSKFPPLQSAVEQTLTYLNKTLLDLRDLFLFGQFG